MQRSRTGFSTAFLALSIQAAALVSSTAFAADNAYADASWWSFDPSSDEFVIPNSLDARIDGAVLPGATEASESYMGAAGASYTPGWDSSVELLHLFQDAGLIDAAWDQVTHMDFLPA